MLNLYLNLAYLNPLLLVKIVSFSTLQYTSVIDIFKKLSLKLIKNLAKKKENCINIPGFMIGGWK